MLALPFLTSIIKWEQNGCCHNCGHFDTPSSTNWPSYFYYFSLRAHSPLKGWEDGSKLSKVSRATA